MKVLILTLLVQLASINSFANLCSEAQKKKASTESKNEVSFYERLFPDANTQGSSSWNELIVECNRKRDTKGSEISKILNQSEFKDLKDLLNEKNLSEEVIEGAYNFFGLLITQQKYRYVLKKNNGVWEMIIPYNPEINDIVKDRIDFEMKTTGGSKGIAHSIYELNQFTVSGSGTSKVMNLNSGAKPIAETLCDTTTFFEGKEKKYDGQNDGNSKKRDRENKYISLGKTQFSYDGVKFAEGCRVKKNVELGWYHPSEKKYVSILPDKLVLENFIEAGESYWSIKDVFTLKLLLKGYNETKFSSSTIAKLKNDDFLKIRFGTIFLPYGGNQVYKTSLIQYNNFSTMSDDGDYRHEVGHAFGLDDEYGGETDKGKKDNGCEHSDYTSMDTLKYQMCNGGVTDKRTIYHYLATSRYVLTQICKTDADCGSGKFCNNRLGINRCLSDGQLDVGESCFKNKECSSNACEGTSGKQVCVCKEDGDCKNGKKCKKKVFNKNICE